jgi:hypothetical protein
MAFSRKRTTNPKRPEIPALPPLTEIELRFHARWAEALSDLLGENPNGAYPPWVCRAAQDTLRWLPPVMLEKARAHPAEYLRGFNDAIALRRSEMLATMPRRQVDRFNRLNRAEWPKALQGQTGFSPKIARVFKRFNIRLVSALVKNGVVENLSLNASARMAYFEGDAFGLDPLANLQRIGDHLKTAVAAGERADRSSVRRVLWLHWPEVEALENRRVLYKACTDWFAASGDRHAVGSFEAFDKFCRREGILSHRRR